MNARVLVGAAVAAALVAAGIWCTRSTGALPAPGSGTVANATPPPEQAGASPRGVEPGAVLSGVAPAPTRTEQALPPPLPLEPVEPLLELIAAAAAENGAGDAQVGTGLIDELLLGKHAGKSKAELERSLNSVKAVLDLQSRPQDIPKDKVLPPDALQALGIEASWLKERIGP